MRQSQKNWIINHIIISAVAFLICHKATAQNTLFFPIEKSTVKILPQQFEYDIIDTEKIRIGNALFDSSSLTFNQLNDNTFRFFWPSALIKDGELTLKDNVGKIIWSKKVIPSEIHVTKKQFSYNNMNLSADSAYIDIMDINKIQQAKIQTTPFMRFCLQKEDDKTKFYLCSKEFVLKNEGKKQVIRLKKIDYNQQISINGQNVGDHGVVHLQSTQDAIFLKMQFRTGSYFDFITRMKEVDFKDIYKTSTGKIQIVANGATPTPETKFTKKNNDDWIADVPDNKTYVYLYGEGGIPLRQEFYIEKNVRPQNLQLNINTTATSTYSNSFSISLKQRSNVEFTTTDKDSQVKKLNAQEWEWTLLDLEKNKINRRYLNVKTPEGEFIGAWDIFRAKRSDVKLLAGFYPVQFSTNYRYAVSRTINFNFDYRNYAETLSNEPRFTSTGIGIDYKLTPGFNSSDRSHFVFITVENQNLNTSALTASNLGACFSFPVTVKYLSEFESLNFKVQSPILISSNDFSSINSIELNMWIRKKISDLSWDLGIQYFSENLTPKTASADIKLNRITATAAINLTF